MQLVDAHRLLSLFAEGIAGRYLHLKPVAALPARLRPGEVPPPTSEGWFVYLPEEIKAFPEPRANFGQYRVALMHQLGFREFGTFDFRLEEARRRLAGLLEPGSAEGRDERSDFEIFFGCCPAPALVRRLFSILEDDRIDSRLRGAYPGLRHDLDRALAHALAEREPLAVVDSPAALEEALLRCTLGDDPAPLCAIDATGLLDALLRGLDAVREPTADVYTSAAAALACAALLGGDAPAPRPVGFRGRPGFELAQLRLRVDAAEARLRSLERLELVGAVERGAAGGIPATGASRPVAKREANRLVRRNAGDRAELQLAFGDVSRAERSFLYDEWDHASRCYVRGWCRLYEHPLKGGDGAAFLERVRQRHGDLLRQVRRRFQHVEPESYRRVGRVREGEDVDLDAAVEAHVDRRAGLAPGDRVYLRRERARREVAAAFLLDLSGSVSQSLPDAEPSPAPLAEDDDYFWGLRDAAAEAGPERTILDVEKEALALMVQALATLGDEYAIYGFSGRGRENVEFYVAKEFAQALGRPVWNAIAAMRPQGSTRMGAAIRHAVRKLERQDAGRKVLLLVSDGFPQDVDYGPVRGDREYGVQDTAQALRDAERAGVQTFCVTVDAAGNDYLREMCPDRQYLVIDEVELLPVELSKVYRALRARA